MSNIFKLTDDFKTIVEMADQLDEQTLEDMLEAIGEATSDKVAKTIAVIKSVKGELDVAKDFKKDLEARIKTMTSTVNRLNEYIMLGVETVGKPKKDAPQFRKLEIKDHPYVKSVWTQYNPPSVEIINEGDLDEEFLIPQPPKANNKLIAERWKENMAEYEAKRSAFILDLQTQVDEGKITTDQADDNLKLWEFENKAKFEISGVEVRQTVGVRYR